MGAVKFRPADDCFYSYGLLRPGEGQGVDEFLGELCREPVPFRIVELWGLGTGDAGDVRVLVETVLRPVGGGVVVPGRKV